MLLIFTAAVVAGQQNQPYCSGVVPLATGGCRNHYLYCVTKVITALIQQTPGSPAYKSNKFHPPVPVSGGVSGYATCYVHSTKAECRSCLLKAKEWLTWYCYPYEGGFYYSYHGCSLSYHQIG
ncbi:hypothetical protein LINGRAHAP2_LOCUS34003 [Linum grandiflorum]